MSVNFYVSSKHIVKNTRIPVFNIELFTIARTWKQPICPSVHEGIRKLEYRYIMVCYSALKTNKSRSVLMRWNECGAYYTECSKSEK